MLRSLINAFPNSFLPSLFLPTPQNASTGESLSPSEHLRFEDTRRNYLNEFRIACGKEFLSKVWVLRELKPEYLAHLYFCQVIR